MNRSVKWLVGMGSVVAMLVLPAAAMAVFPGVNGKILFVSGRDTGGDAEADIYLIDGPNDVTLNGPTDLIAGQHRHPNWSPDGRFITFALRFGGDDDILVKDTQDGSTVLLGLGSAPNVLEDHPTYSPDGASIAYESEVTNGSNQEDILVGPADGTGTTINLTNSGTLVEQTPVWSPDGQFIYYARKTDNASTNLDIYREPADNSGSPVAISDAATGANEFQPEISPDGTQICYTVGPFGSNDADIMVANVDSSGTPFEESATDTMTPIADYDCGWSPDGATIAFTTGTFGTGQLQFAPSNDSGPITPYGNNSTFFDGNVDWSRDQHTCQGRLVTKLGTAGKDHLQGTSGKDVIVGLSGNDHVEASAGNDFVCGGAGDDNLEGQAGKDHLFGGVGSDDLAGGAGHDECVGGPGHDTAKNCEKTSSVKRQRGLCPHALCFFEDQAGLGGHVDVTKIGVSNRLAKLMNNQASSVYNDRTGAAFIYDNRNAEGPHICLETGDGFDDMTDASFNDMATSTKLTHRKHCPL
jgi:Tol biopolymer transport system component